MLLFIPVLVVYADQRAAEGEYFAKSDEDRVVDLAQWWADKARGEHYAPEGAQCSSGDELEVFHGVRSLWVQEFRKFRSSGVLEFMGTSEQARSATEPLNF